MTPITLDLDALARLAEAAPVTIAMKGEPVPFTNALRFYNAARAAVPKLSTELRASPQREAELAAEIKTLNDLVRVCQDGSRDGSELLTLARTNLEISARAEAAEARVRELTEWRDIASAPKDGTHITVGTFPCLLGCISTTTAHWFEGEWALSINFDGEHSDCGVKAPTHWLPLPVPPSVKRGANE